MFRYVDVKKLLEVEVGMTQNEPKQLAVKEEIEKSVSSSDEEGDTAQDNKALGATSSD